MRKLPQGDGTSSQISCTVKLYVLGITGKKEKGDFGEITVNMWTSDAAAQGSLLSPGVGKRTNAVRSEWVFCLRGMYM